MTVSVLILAAGVSARMGRAKQLMPFGGRPMLGAVISRYLAAACVRRVLVVVNPSAPVITRTLSEYPVQFVPNPFTERGMFSSVQAGLRAAGQLDELLIGLCDQPSLSPYSIARIVRVAKESGKEIVIPTFGGRGGHPIFVCKRFVPEILSMPVTLTLKRFVAAHRNKTLRVALNDAGVVQDLDDPLSYQIATQETR